MLTLLTFAPALGEPSLSNFCSKAMILLEMAGEDWTAEFPQDLERSVFGKLPTVETPDGKIGDSNLLILWLEARGATLFPGLTPGQRAQAHGVIRMVEENLRYGMMYERWIRDESWAEFMPLAFAGMPEEMRGPVSGQIREGIRQGLTWQGLARFGEAERMAYFNADLDALTALLEDGGWLFGDAPCAADAAALPVLSSLDRLQVDCDLRRAVRGNPTLMSYIARGRERLYQPLLTSSVAAA